MESMLAKMLSFKSSVCFTRLSPFISLMSTFKGKLDNFNGVTIDTIQENINLAQFKNKLEESLKLWTKENKRIIWFRVEVSHSSFIPPLTENGFKFHHIKDGYLMMYKWLPRDRAPNVPPAAHTNVGVGAMVFNSKDQILAISEKHYHYPHWKLPGGYVEKGENLIDAAVREVKEETGINAEFKSLVTFRHTHNMAFGNSDIYAVIRMSALSENIVLPAREVSACKWMAVSEYLNHEHVHLWNKKVVQIALEHQKQNIKLNIENATVKFAITRNINYLTVEKNS